MIYIRNLIVLGFLILLVQGCSTGTVHRKAVPTPYIKPRRVSHLQCVKELLHMDVKPEKANEICIAIFRRDYEE